MQPVRAMSAFVLLAATAAAQDTVRMGDAAGRVSIEVPRAWDLEQYEAEQAILGLRREVPDVGYVWISIYLLQGSRDPLAQAWFEHDVRVLDKDVRGAEVEAGPPPRLIYRYETLGEKRVSALTYFVVRRSGVSVRFACMEEAWPRLKDQVPSIAASLRVELEEWPPHPPDYERSVEDDYVWYVQPGVEDRAVKELRSYCRSTERKFEKVHGKLRIDPESPPIIVVCRSIGDVRGLYEPAKNNRYGAALDELGGRVFLTPFPKDAGPEQADAANLFWRLLLIAKYGGHWPTWMAWGEGDAAWAEERTGKRLPFVHKELWKRLPADPIPFGKLLEMEAARVLDDTFDSNAAAYLLLFRAGPAKYRAAYKAFLADFAETKDGNGAVERHLGALDQARMRDDLAKWLSKSVKVAERK